MSENHDRGPASERLGLTISAGDFPTSRTRKGEEASVQTLIEELHVVVERHEGPLSAVEIVQTVLDYGDSYAEVLDVPMKVEMATDPEGRDVALVHYPGTGVDPSPIGKWPGLDDTGEERGLFRPGVGDQDA